MHLRLPPHLWGYILQFIHSVTQIAHKMGDTNLQPPVASKTAHLPPAIYPHAPSSIPDDVRPVVESWVNSLTQVLKNNSFDSFKELFQDESYWRDHLCLSWDLRTFHGPEKIQSFLERNSKGLRIKCITIDESDEFHIPKVKALDHKGKITGIRSYLKIETDVGTGKGLLNLSKDPDQGSWKAFTLYTCLQELSRYKETIKYNRRLGTESFVDVGNYYGGLPGNDRTNNQPTVLVVGKNPDLGVSDSTFHED
jgi:hypothetical protein